MIEQFYMTEWWNTNRYYHLGQSGPGINGNDRVLYNLQIFRILFRVINDNHLETIIASINLIKTICTQLHSFK